MVNNGDVMMMMLNYGKLYDLWEAHPEWWFSGIPLPDLLPYSQLPSPDPLRSAPRKELIGYIISRDQIPRNQPIRDPSLTASSLWAVDLVIDMHVPLTAFEFIFVYLPLRHVGEYHRVIVDAVRWVGEWGCPPLMKRFLMATLQRCPHAERLCSVIGNTSIDLRKDFEDVLEPVVAPHNPHLITLNLPKHQEVVVGNVVLSLSGGVDSMVCMDLMINAAIPFKAVHVNYMNRGDVAAREQEFVEAYCKLRGVELYVRTIDEIQRGFCVEHGLREGYELYTKNARFAAYKEAGADVVVLGHNRDDAFENIITNIKRGQKYDNLVGIGLKGEWDKELCLYRPLVGVSKEDIFEYAHQKGIPYLKDTTVKWCERWKVRNVVAPAMYHMDAYDGFFALADTCKELSMVYDLYLRNLLTEWKNKGHLKIGVDHPLATSAYFAWRFWNVIAPHVKRKSIGEYLSRLRGMSARGVDISQRIVLNVRLMIKVVFKDGEFVFC
jgi:tRNA(Ile)-lysidine synthetase-like protein